MKKLKINRNDSGQRADKFITKAFPRLPASLMYKAFRKKDIKLDGNWIKANTVLPEGGELTIYLPDDCFAEKRFSPVDGCISIIYEDENIAVIDKDRGVPCQSDSSGKAALCDIFKTYLYNRKEYDPEKERSFSPALCNRIDTNTCGLVIGAKNAAALRAMNEEIRARRVKKYYLCLTEGFPPKAEDTVTLTLEKDSAANKSKASQTGKETVTRYRVIGETENGAKCEVELLTGRSHQIRAVMAYLGCPIIGDKKYGASSGGGQALISYKIAFEPESPLLSYLNGKIFHSAHTF